MAVTMSMSFSSCFLFGGDDDDDDDKQDSTADALVGTWVCDFDEDTDYIFCFKSDGTGYDYFTEDGLDEDDYFSYKVRGKTITLYYEEHGWDYRYNEPETEYYNITIEYDLRQNGKSLTLYGLDDNDMAVLHFTKRNK